MRSLRRWWPVVQCIWIGPWAPAGFMGIFFLIFFENLSLPPGPTLHTFTSPGPLLYVQSLIFMSACGALGGIGELIPPRWGVRYPWFFFLVWHWLVRNTRVSFLQCFFSQKKHPCFFSHMFVRDECSGTFCGATLPKGPGWIVSRHYTDYTERAHRPVPGDGPRQYRGSLLIFFLEICQSPCHCKANI